MKQSIFALLATIAIFSGCCSKCYQIQKHKTSYDTLRLKPSPITATKIALVAETGFYDPTTASQSNFYGRELEYLHGYNGFNQNGFLAIPFEEKINPMSTSIFPQMNIAFAGLPAGKTFTVKIYMFANLDGDSSAVATFVGTYNNDSGSGTTQLATGTPLTIKQSQNVLTIQGLGPTNTGIYYLSLWGQFSNTNLWYEVQEIDAIPDK